MVLDAADFPSGVLASAFARDLDEVSLPTRPIIIGSSAKSEVFETMPRMLHATVILRQSEKMAAPGGLVIGSINRKTRIMTIQESTNATVADKEDIAGSISRQDVLDLAHNAQLGINRSLPAPNAGVGLREKLMSHRLKLVRYQEARRRSIVLMHRFTKLYVDVQFCGNNLGCLDRLPLSAGNDLCRSRERSRACYCFSACSPDLTEAPGWNGNGRINIHLRMGKIAYDACHN